MYNDWASLASLIQTNISGAHSVLGKFSSATGKDVAVVVVKQLAATLGITQPPETSNLQTDQEVLWCMDVLAYGLSLPLVEHETIKDCVNVYCEWLTCLHPIPKVCVPRPICDDPNVYARKILQHLHNLFIPRAGEGADTINRQAVLCHRVLRTLQHAVQMSLVLNRETWEALLLFLLAINDLLLAPPTMTGDVGDQLCERVLSVLFEVWLQACVRSFPSPSLWKTFQESCAKWRHRVALVEQWNRVNLALTARLLDFTYGPTFPEVKIADDDAVLIPVAMTNDCIAQSWYRFLRMIGSPVGLCCPHSIAHTQQFMQFVMSREDGMEPHQHPCLLNLPQIFLKSIKGLSCQVDAFLGIYQAPPNWDEQNNFDSSFQSHTSATSRHSGGELRNMGSSSLRGEASIHNTHHGNFNSSSSSSGSGGVGGVYNNSSGGNSSASGQASTGGGGNSSTFYSSAAANIGIFGGSTLVIDNVPNSPTPPLQRRLAKSFSVAPSTGAQLKGLSKSSLIGLTSSRSSGGGQPTTPTSGPPSSSSFTSMLAITSENRPPLAATRPKCNSILHLFGEWLFEAAHIGTDSWFQNTKKQATEASRRPSSMIMDSRKGSLSLSQPSSLNEPSSLPPGLTIDKFESGRAEAIGTLCRIFCAKKTGEEILPVYLARFYVALQQGLKISESRDVEETLASILYNSADLFRLDLDGIQVLLPYFIAALELVLPEKELRMRSQYVVVNKNELRRASIHILLSILVLPLHFQSLPIRDLSGAPEKTVTFIQLKPRLINILMNALQVETDAQNTHMLLGGLLLTVQDAVAFEESEQSGGDLLQPSPADGNLLSSACSEKSAYSIASAASNSSLSGHSATHGNEPVSLTISDDFPAQILHDLEMTTTYDNAHALFVRATYLVCHRLISSWKTDLNVSLAALELLSGLARMHIKDSDALECKRAVKWICDYICYQCSRPPPAHSKDLHSTIVAAFQCTSAWLMQHSFLLQDKDCLTTVLEVVELGISGTKSVGKPGEPIKQKDEKELKPASMRVRDAAENLLTIIMEQVSYFPNELGPQSLSSLLDEVALVKHCNSASASISQEQALQKFKYFVTENSTVLALLEEPLGNDQDPQPTVTLLIRGPFGRYAWTMQLRHLPRSKSGTKYHQAPNPGRPVPMNDMPMRQEVEQKFFPDSVERIPPCVADYSIPNIDTVLAKMGNVDTQKLYKLLEDQVVYEKFSWAQTESSADGFLGHAQEAAPPPICHEFQTARLFLSHFGLLSLGENNTAKAEEHPDRRPLLTVLNSKKSTFVTDLQMLDKMSPRTCDSIHVFYVKNGQSTEREIIGNMLDENIGTLDAHFWNMLQTLGWPVNIDDHAGWTGNVHTSWRLGGKSTEGGKSGGGTFGGSDADDLRFNGVKRVLYWADVASEMAFVVPTFQNKSEERPDSVTENPIYERSTSEMPKGEKSAPSTMKFATQKPRTLSLDFEKPQSMNENTTRSADPIPPSRRRAGTNKPAMFGSVCAKIMLVWLESQEDHLTFPIDDLLAYTRTGEESQSGVLARASDCHVIYLHALNSGLLRVRLQGPASRMSFATPLVDGMVVSKRVVGNLVRQTAYNMSKRRRLDNDSYQPPHVRRRFKVQEMVQKYKLDMTEPELLAHLFQNSI